mgnify:CR=1 FL=1
MLKKIGKRLKDQRGLTLVELLAVIVILGIIAAIAVPSIGNVIAKSKFEAAKADAIQVINSAKLYVAANGTPSSDLTINSSDEDNKLAEFIEEVNNLDSYSVTITTNGKITMTAEAKNGDKNGEKTIEGDLSKVNSYTYKTGAPAEPTDPTEPKKD